LTVETSLDRIRELGTFLAERLTRYELVLGSAFDNSPMPMALVNGDYYIMVNNSFCALLGYDRAAIENIPWRLFVHPEDLALSEQAYESMLSGPLSRFRNRLRTKTGDFVAVEWWATARQDGVSLAFANPVEARPGNDG